MSTRAVPLWLGLVIYCAFGTANASGPFLSIYAVDQRGAATAADMGPIASSRSVAQFLIVIIVPYLVERVGTVRLLTTTIAVQSIATALMGGAAIVPDTAFVAYLMAIQFIRGLAVGCFEVTMGHAMINGVALDEVPGVLGPISVAGGIGMIIGPVMGARLFASGFPIPFLVGGAMLMLSCVLWAILVTPANTESDERDKELAAKALIKGGEHKPPAAIDEPLSVWIVLRVDTAQ